MVDGVRKSQIVEELNGGNVIHNNLTNCLKKSVIVPSERTMKPSWNSFFLKRRLAVIDEIV